jgi:hypothetical protein
MSPNNQTQVLYRFLSGFDLPKLKVLARRQREIRHEKKLPTILV